MATTTNYNIPLFDSSTEGNKTFSEYVDNINGLSVGSGMNIIDTVLKANADAIASIDVNTMPYKYTIPSYSENVLVPADTTRRVIIPFDTGGYLPKKVVLYDTAMTSDYLNISASVPFVVEIVKQGTFFTVSTIATVAKRLNTTITYSYYVPNMIVLDGDSDFEDVFGFYVDLSGTQVRGYGADAFCGTSFINSTSNFLSVTIGNFAYNTTQVEFDFNVSSTADYYTNMGFRGYIY